MPFTNGLIKCGSCDCSITAELQKGHVYYRCTRKKGICEEKYIREELLVEQMKEFLRSVSLSDQWTEQMLRKVKEEKQCASGASKVLVDSFKNEVESIDTKLDKLLDAHLDSTVDKETYVKKKALLLSQKIDLDQKISRIQQNGNDSLEPMRDFILHSNQSKKIANDGDPMELRAFLTIVGSNFLLTAKKLQIQAKKPYNLVAEISPNSSLLRGLDSNQNILLQREESCH